MGNFNDIVPKRLNILPARQATLAEAQSAPIPFDKYYTLQPARDIKKIVTYLDLPAFECPAADFKYVGQLLFQYNVVVPAPFYIVNPIVESGHVGGTLTVKWRVGNLVHRYFIAGYQRKAVIVNPPPYTTELRDFQTFPFYTTQLIPVNCVFEFWGMPTFALNPGLPDGYNIAMSFLNDPQDPDQTRIDIQLAAPLLNIAIGNNLPVALPVAQPLIAFNSN